MLTGGSSYRGRSHGAAGGAAECSAHLHLPRPGGKSPRFSHPARRAQTCVLGGNMWSTSGHMLPQRHVGLLRRRARGLAVVCSAHFQFRCVTDNVDRRSARPGPSSSHRRRHSGRQNLAYCTRRPGFYKVSPKTSNCTLPELHKPLIIARAPGHAPFFLKGRRSPGRLAPDCHAPFCFYRTGFHKPVPDGARWPRPLDVESRDPPCYLYGLRVRARPRPLCFSAD